MRDRDVLSVVAALGLGLVGGLAGRQLAMRGERRRLDGFEDEIDQLSRRISAREGRAGQDKRRRMRDHEAELEELAARANGVAGPPAPASGLAQLQQLARAAFPRRSSEEV